VSLMDRFAEGAQSNAMTMAGEALDLLRQIRDQTGEGTAARETFFVRPIAVDVLGGVGQGEWNLPGGVGVQLSSLAVVLPGTGGRVAVYAGGVSPAALLKILPGPGAAINGIVADTATFGPSDYVPENGKITVVAEGIATDGRATVVLRGKMFVVGDAMDTNHAGS
jgi:hypothetical protein